MYDAGKYGVITRKWFGLTKKWGGDVAAGYSSAATKGATAVTHLSYWYPRGPVKIVKVGRMVLATLTNASSDRWVAAFRTRGASASVAATVALKSTSTAVSIAAIASKETMTIEQCKAGEYISIRTSTPVTDKATTVAATTTGTIAFFVDYEPVYDAKHHIDTKTV